jgi:hypothetical protein
LERSVTAHYFELRRLAVHTAQTLVTGVREGQLAYHQWRLINTLDIRMDAEHRDGMAKPFLRHVQQEQQARDAAGCGRLFTIAMVMVREE